ncbi:hypothetical protein ACLOJK_004550, partial [Asimina triloba]
MVAVILQAEGVGDVLGGKIRPFGHEGGVNLVGEGESLAAVGLVGGSRNLEGKEGAVNSWVAAVIVIVGLFMLGFAVVVMPWEEFGGGEGCHLNC